ncbi:class I SAM-dependent methyltransferase [Halopelagius fulvigenes]|uniref:Class I SAM-dependent methyltransferase n=1 Tax=Halopelagius fulvigenes TaxID=1198324 RepID=A0ABD5TYM6_9EURY
MGFHTFDVARAESLDDEGRYRYCSREELLALLAPSPGEAVADLGSGTGFYTDDVAPAVGTLYAVDVQAAMHEFYREKGVPPNVELVTADVESLPFADGELDAALSTMVYHEFASDDAVTELGRVLRPDGRLVTVDWSKAGPGEAGPPTDERFGLGDAVSTLEDGGFVVTEAASRRETFVCVARRTE